MKIFKGENIEAYLDNNSKKVQILHISISNDSGHLEPGKTLLKKIKLDKKKFDKNKILIISGKLTNWLLSYICFELSFVKTIAVFNPNFGAMIVKSKSEKFIAGAIINEKLYKNSLLKLFNESVCNKTNISKAEKENTSSKVIAFTGSSNCGKSVLARALISELKKLKSINFQNDYYLIRACPDGEGDWFGDLLKDEYKVFRIKKVFDITFVKEIVKSINKQKEYKKLIFIDCGGKISKENQNIFNICTHSILVYKDKKEFDHWAGALKICGVNILAVIKSSKGEFKSRSTGSNRYVLYNLDRSNNNISIPSKLIQQIIN